MQDLYFNKKIMYNGLYENIGIYRLILIVVLIILTIAFWKIFEKSGEQGWYSLIPLFNIFVLSRVAQKTKSFRYVILGVILAMIFGYFHFPLLCELSFLFAYIQGCIINYSLAQNFGRKNSASFLFAVATAPGIGIKYLLLGFSSDEYIVKNNNTHIKIEIPEKQPIDDNILKDIENEIHDKHLGDYNDTNGINNNLINNNGNNE